ncbi:MAG: hypothetical protein FWH41_02765 [Treponema sp.]|nr:hypothetical protein [Treponema sp.]
MKYIAIILGVFLLFSCAGAGTEETANVSPLVGTWEYENSEVKIQLTFDNAYFFIHETYHKDSWEESIYTSYYTDYGTYFSSTGELNVDRWDYTIQNNFLYLEQFWEDGKPVLMYKKIK